MTFDNVKAAILLRDDYEATRRLQVVIRLPDGSLAPVRAVTVTPHEKTGEPSIVLDTREMV